jgi:GNAT superfamily N-acetyltransferase
VRRRVSNDKPSKSYPAVLIGRLGVSKNYWGQGIGTQLLDFIKAWFVDEGNKTGCRFIVVDSYNEPQPLKFYQKSDFRFLIENEDLEKEYSGIAVDENLLTRLMFYDLILISPT